jgi:hypothetical protein
MAGWGKQNGDMRGNHQAAPGQVSESSNELETIQSGPDQMTYRGYVPQRYIPPGQIAAKHNAGEVGDGTVPNNTDRGNYGHGVEVDSEVWAKDHSRRDVTDQVPQVMPEEEDQREYDPIKVTIVDKSPDELIKTTITTVNITANTPSAQGTNAATGMTPIRILGKDPRRTRAYVTVISFTSGGTASNGVASQAVVLNSQNQPPVYGFPLQSTRMEILATDEVWVAGQNIADVGIIGVYAERAVNSDRLEHD